MSLPSILEGLIKRPFLKNPYVDMHVFFNLKLSLENQNMIRKM